MSKFLVDEQSNVANFTFSLRSVECLKRHNMYSRLLILKWRFYDIPSLFSSPVNPDVNTSLSPLQLPSLVDVNLQYVYVISGLFFPFLSFETLSSSLL